MKRLKMHSAQMVMQLREKLENVCRFALAIPTPIGDDGSKENNPSPSTKEMSAMVKSNPH
jgi:hypothetical protein